MLSKIKKWGNSAAVRLPAKVLAAAGLEAGATISIKTKGNKIIIEAVTDTAKKKLKLPFTESQLLSGLTPHTAHADELAELSAVEFRD